MAATQDARNREQELSNFSPEQREAFQALIELVSSATAEWDRCCAGNFISYTTTTEAAVGRICFGITCAADPESEYAIPADGVSELIHQKYSLRVIRNTRAVISLKDSKIAEELFSLVQDALSRKLRETQQQAAY